MHDKNTARVTAVDDVSVSIKEGEFVALMGRSGCGKSTLLHLLGALLRPSAGDVLVAGIDTSDLADDELSRLRRGTIGFVFQSFNLVPVLDIEQNVALPMLIDGRTRQETRHRLDDVLEEVGIGRIRHKMPHTLSGGQQQLVAIARALMLEPTVVLADEPTGNLDSANGATVLRLLSDLHGTGRTIVLATHDARIAGPADRLLLMRDGAVSEHVRREVPVMALDLDNSYTTYEGSLDGASIDGDVYNTADDE